MIALLHDTKSLQGGPTRQLGTGPTGTGRTEPGATGPIANGVDRLETCHVTTQLGFTNQLLVSGGLQPCGFLPDFVIANATLKSVCLEATGDGVGTDGRHVATDACRRARDNHKH